MSAALRTLLILSLIFAATAGFAQESTETTTTTAATETTATTTTAETTATTTAADEPQSAEKSKSTSSYEVRGQFNELMRRHSDEVSTVVALEPGLLSNEQFLAGHPELGNFVKEHPEVSQHASFFVAELPRGVRRRSALEDIIEALAIFGSFAGIALALAWLVRTIIEQKRWNRLTKTQSEVHTKILDRFGSTDELLQYIKTPAGSKFLESAPIPLHVERKFQPQPQARVLWSIQAGVVIAAAALGMLLVSLRFDQETGSDLFALGVIGFFLGAGFILSALVSLTLSRRLGIGQQPPVEDADVVR